MRYEIEDGIPPPLVRNRRPTGAKLAIESLGVGQSVVLLSQNIPTYASQVGQKTGRRFTTQVQGELSERPRDRSQWRYRVWRLE